MLQLFFHRTEGIEIRAMIYTILDNCIIFLLTVAGICFGNEAALLILAAGLLMILVTWRSFREEPNVPVLMIEAALMICFAGLSGSWIGCIIFFLLRDIPVWIRGISGVTLSVLAEQLIQRTETPAESILHALFLVVIYIILECVIIWIRRMREQKQQEEERLRASNVSEMHEKQANEELLRQNVLAEKNARLVERENISRNIHNSVGHSITAAIMTLDAADMLYDVKPEEARKKMNDANERIRGSLESIRRAVRVLDEEATEIAASDLMADMESIIHEFVMDHIFRVDRDFSRLPAGGRIPGEHAVFLTGALQEFLTNGVKHGNATEFVVILMGDSAHIRLEVSDNGTGDFAEENRDSRIRNGFGIKKIISYAEKNGGKAEFTNDHGFRSMVELPIYTSSS